jgi:molecular chaperone GrpE
MPKDPNQHDLHSAADADPNGDSGAAFEADAIETTEDVAALVQQLQAERDQAIAGRQRAHADFANYQRRASDNEKQARQMAIAGVVRSLLPVLDHFTIALNQDPRTITADQFAAGIRLVYDELLKALAAQSIQRIEPKIGEEFTPGRHEAMMLQPMPGAGPNRIASVMQVGYALGDTVLRPAKVAVTPSEA